MARRIALGRRVEGNAPYQSAGFAPGRSTGRAGCPHPAGFVSARRDDAQGDLQLGEAVGDVGFV